jgi:hypothetical protein
MSTTCNTVFNNIEMFKQHFRIVKSTRKNIQLQNASIYEMIDYALEVCASLAQIGQDHVSTVLLPVFSELLVLINTFSPSDRYAIQRESSCAQVSSKYGDRVLFPTTGEYKIQVYLHILISALFRRLDEMTTKFEGFYQFLDKHGTQNESGNYVMVDIVYELAPSRVYQTIKHFSQDEQWARYVNQSVTSFRNSLKLCKQKYTESTLNSANIYTLMMLVLDQLEYTEVIYGTFPGFFNVKEHIYPLIASIHFALEDNSKVNAKLVGGLVAQPFYPAPGQITSLKHGSTPIYQSGTKPGLHVLTSCLLNRILHLKESQQVDFSDLDRYLVQSKGRTFDFVDDVFQSVSQVIQEKRVKKATRSFI